jgi:hypothetical protein
VLDIPLKLRFKYCFHPVNFADTENLLPLDTVTGVVFQTLFFAANVGVATKKQLIATTTITAKTLFFISTIITLTMSLKQILLMIVLAILVVSSTAFLIIKKNQTSTVSSEITTTSPTPTIVPLATWTDEAGFTFQYPESTKVDKHPEDTKNYANLTLTLPSSDTVNIIMADNTFKDLNSWAGQNSAIDTTLGGKSAKKIIKDGQTTVACIDNEVLVTITGKDISTIVDSWTFVYPTSKATKTTNTTNTNVSNDSGDVLEEE